LDSIHIWRLGLYSLTVYCISLRGFGASTVTAVSQLGHPRCQIRTPIKVQRRLALKYLARRRHSAPGGNSKIPDSVTQHYPCQGVCPKHPQRVWRTRPPTSWLAACARATPCYAHGGKPSQCPRESARRNWVGREVNIVNEWHGRRRTPILKNASPPPPNLSAHKPAGHRADLRSLRHFYRIPSHPVST
jgi:hypothetical protein